MRQRLRPLLLINARLVIFRQREEIKKAYDNYANVKADIDEIIRRIELNPTDKGFMPFKKSQKMAADTIAIFKSFKDGGSLEN